eukprot:COSAG06_NODE_895_length_11669_cov_5.131384_9_plen_257_part_00
MICLCVSRLQVKGVNTAINKVKHTYDNGSGPDRISSFAHLASWTAVARVAMLTTTVNTSTTTTGGAGGPPLKMAASASALDLRNGTYMVATPAASGAADGHCIQTTYAHRGLQHLLITEFRCSATGTKPLHVTVSTPRCEDSFAPAYIYLPLCDKLHNNITADDTGPFNRVTVPSHNMAGVRCTRSSMHHSESPDTPNAVVGECHTDVPAAGLHYTIAPGSERLISLISSRCGKRLFAVISDTKNGQFTKTGSIRT